MIILDVIKFGLVYGCFIGLISSGFSLIYNVLHVVDFAHTDRMVLCGYFFLEMLKLTSQPVAILLTIAFGLLLSSGTEITLYRNVRKVNPSMLLLSSFGLSIVLQNLMALWFGDGLREYPLAEKALESNLFVHEYLLMPLLLLLLLLLYLFLNKTKCGISIKALISNPERALTIGVSSNRVYTVIFSISGFIAAIGGMYLSIGYGLTPFSGFKIMIYAFSACLLAGLDNMYGSVIFGIIIGLLLSVFEYFFNALSAEALTLLLLVLIMFLKPRGLFGKNLRTV